MQDQLIGIPEKDKVWGPVTSVTPAEFITPVALSELVGLSSVGDWLHENSGWLKISLDKTYYISKLALKNNLTWEDINAVGCVMGEKIVTIHGKNYKVRLMTGANRDPVTSLVDAQSGGEYTDLFLRCTQYYLDSANRWGDLSFNDVGWSFNGLGCMTLCKEMQQVNAQIRRAVGRGRSDNYSSTQQPQAFRAIWAVVPRFVPQSGWRPILELIE